MDSEQHNTKIQLAQRAHISTQLIAGLMANPNVIVGIDTERDEERVSQLRQLIANQAIAQADALLTALEPDEVMDVKLEGGE